MTIPDQLSSALSDRYRFDRELGAGGMATVYLAHDLKHDRDVAISGQGARTFHGALRRRYRAGSHVSTSNGVAMNWAANVFLLAVAPLLMGLAPTVGSPLSALRKCAMPVDKTPRHFIDGRLTDSSAFKRLDSSDVITVMVLCVDPVDYTVIRPGTQTPGLLTISVWTSKGPSVQLEPFLRKLTDSQRKYFARTGEYAVSLRALGLDELPPHVSVTLDATASRWRATAVVERPTSPRCTVFGGDHDAPIPGATDVVRCFDPP